MGTQNILHPIYRPRQAIRRCEDGILKFHAVLEISVKNPKLRTHFFELEEFPIHKFLTYDSGRRVLSMAKV